MGGIALASWVNRNVSSAKDDVKHVGAEIKKQANITLNDLKNVSKLGLKDISLNNIKDFTTHLSHQGYDLYGKTLGSPKLDAIKAYATTATVAFVTGGAIIIPPKSIIKLEQAQRKLTDRAMGVIPKDRKEAMNYAKKLVEEAKRQNITLDPEIYEMANGNVPTQYNPLMIAAIVGGLAVTGYVIMKLNKK